MMGKDEYNRRLHEVIWTAGASARYHQKQEAKFDWWDFRIRIAVAVVAIIAVIFSIPPLGMHWWSFAVDFLAVIVAVILNVTPVVERAKFHSEMYRSWSELRREALQEQLKTCEGDPADHHAERLSELVSRVETLNTNEKHPDVRLQKECEDEEDVSEYGEVQPAIRPPTSSSASAAAPV